MWAIQPKQQKNLITPFGQFTSSTGRTSQTGHCVRRACVGKHQGDTNALAGWPAPIYSAKAWPCLTPTACFQDSIDEEPNLVLQQYFNKANEVADMLEPSHTITQLRKHFGYSRHYEVLLAKFRTWPGLRSPHDYCDLTITLRGCRNPTKYSLTLALKVTN